MSWPFHNGLRAVSMGKGADSLASDEPLRQGIEAAGWRLSHERIDPVDESRPEIARIAELIRRLAAGVGTAVEEGAFPFVLAGSALHLPARAAMLRRCILYLRVDESRSGAEGPSASPRCR